MKRPGRWAALLLVAALLLAGCAHYAVNEPSDRFDPQTGYRFDALAPGPGNSDSLFVCLMFSGGGPFLRDHGGATRYGRRGGRPGEAPSG